MNRLTIISQRGKVATCLCVCGNITEVNIYKVRSGHTRSCGCLRKETRMPVSS